MESLKGSDLADSLKKLGFKVLSKRGNHTILRKGNKRIIVPHSGELAKGTIASILEQAGLNLSDLPITEPVEELDEFEEVKEEEIMEESGFFRSSCDTMSRIVPLAIYRVLIGFLFLQSALSKAPWLDDFGWFGAAVNKVIAEPGLSVVGDLFSYVVKPNLAFFLLLQFLIEFTLALALLFGLFTVITSFFGQFWVLTVWISVLGWQNEWVWSYIMLFFALLLFWTMRAGRSFGLDYFLSVRANILKQNSMFWRMISWFT